MLEQDSTSTPSACPQCGGHDFKRWDYRHPVVIHWLVNPGLCVNELVLGQRLPKVMLICKTCPGAYLDNSYVPCGACGAMNRGRLWSGAAFGHWCGLVCPSCNHSIPCIWNVWSLMILVVTFPIWYLPFKFIRPRWLAWEKQRIQAAQLEVRPSADEIPWLRDGMVKFGGTMWILNSGLSIIRGESLWTIVASLPIWAAAGLLFGLMMKRWMTGRPKAVS